MSIISLVFAGRPNKALHPTSPKMRCIFGAVAELGR